jgi:hypothetical protein
MTSTKTYVNHLVYGENAVRKKGGPGGKKLDSVILVRRFGLMSDLFDYRFSWSTGFLMLLMVVKRDWKYVQNCVSTSQLVRIIK